MTSIVKEISNSIPYFEETQQIKKATVMIDVDDLSLFHRYEEECAKQKENDDLTREFLAEIKDISHSSPRK